MNDSKPPLLVRAWMMAHLYGAKYQAIVCCGGSSGEAAFRESLRAQYTSQRHDAKGLHTYYITGTCGDAAISRIAGGRIGTEVAGTDGGPLHITVMSNTHAWQEGDLLGNKHVHTLDLEAERLVEISAYFLRDCWNLQGLDLAPLHSVELIPPSFLQGCYSLEELDLSPLISVRKVAAMFLCECHGLTSINLAPLHALEIPTEMHSLVVSHPLI